MFSTVNIEYRNSSEAVSTCAHLGEEGRVTMWICYSAYYAAIYTIYVHIHTINATEANQLNASAPSALSEHFLCILFHTK